MSAPDEIISDEEIVRVHGHANFGSMTPREVVNDGVRKYAVGYTGGSTQLSILREHGLITAPKGISYQANLTEKGKRYARSIYDTTVAAAHSEAAARLGELYDAGMMSFLQYQRARDAILAMSPPNAKDAK